MTTKVNYEDPVGGFRGLLTLVCGLWGWVFGWFVDKSPWKDGWMTGTNRWLGSQCGNEKRKTWSGRLQGLYCNWHLSMKLVLRLVQWVFLVRQWWIAVIDPTTAVIYDVRDCLACHSAILPIPTVEFLIASLLRLQFLLEPGREKCGYNLRQKIGSCWWDAILNSKTGDSMSKGILGSWLDQHCDWYSS